MKTLMNVCNFLAIVMVAFSVSLTLGAAVMYFTNDVVDMVDITFFGGIFLAQVMKCFD